VYKTLKAHKRIDVLPADSAYSLTSKGAAEQLDMQLESHLTKAVRLIFDWRVSLFTLTHVTELHLHFTRLVGDVDIMQPHELDNI